jgi:hypothetical protein
MQEYYNVIWDLRKGCGFIFPVCFLYRLSRGLFYLNIEILSLINNTYSDKVVHHILNKVYVCIIYYKYGK